MVFTNLGVNSATTADWLQAMQNQSSAGADATLAHVSGFGEAGLGSGFTRQPESAPPPADANNETLR